MVTLYCDARFKIERAKKHIADVHSAIDALKDACAVTVEHRPDGGQSLNHEIPNLENALKDLSLTTGDAIHNLHAALDFAWCATIARCLPDKVSSNNRFPVREKRQDVEATLHGIQIDTRCKPLFEFIVSQVKPYNGTHNCAVWTLHQLDILDKHLVLLGLDPSGQIDGVTIRGANGELQRGRSMPSHGIAGKYTIPFERGINVEEKGKLSVEVTLQEAGIFQSLSIKSLLSDFANITIYIVQFLENIVCD